MRVLALHSNFIEYEPVEKEIDAAEDAEKGRKVRLDDILVAFIAVEKGDDESIAEKVSNEIRAWLKRIGCDRVLLYPYAHLSSDLARAGDALAMLRKVEAMLNTDGVSVYKAPFGWTKAFTISIKGHPLAEHSISLAKIVQEPSKGSVGVKASREATLSQALQREERLTSRWYILEPDGSKIPLEHYDLSRTPRLKMLAEYEVKKRREVDEEPPHVRLMKRLAIADHEPASDAGNLRFYPKGRLIKSLIEQYVTRKVIEYGAVEVETPIMYDVEHPSLASYFNRFPARQYMIESEGKEFFLRFAACFGQFLMAKDFTISYKHLPLKIYELTRYSFRREKSGELVGLRRLRAFTMPDCHALCRDVEQAKQEMLKRLELSKQVIEGLGLSLMDDVEVAIRVTSDFYNENREFIAELVRRIGKPVLLEEWSERFFYFVLKWEFNFVDNLAKASALSTDQIDVENGARYGIYFVDEDGSRKNPIILHNSPSGAVERVMYALLEKAYRMQKEGKTPMLPLWLSPTQVRLIPVSTRGAGKGKDDDSGEGGRNGESMGVGVSSNNSNNASSITYMDYCNSIMHRLERSSIRVDIDDRDESVGKRIREAEMEWIPYIVVVGEKEIASDRLSVRDRASGKVREMSVEELEYEIASAVKDKPYIPLNMPRYLSMRPQIMV
ncbi:threonine--tRNA ligase [Candidatus Nitrosocaldus cavascurensis]|jgi:threonyl-tRNA synthetase|uniref:Threonine--tRNA ligase n=1 Tax=Candidatus Nitrosocaldus cavascurensis TaxID=2058097 RepID=A0A2K5AS97_9ARCH|nr:MULTISPECIES: threonine--tRNA ligase [Candidatus Nitrosocaldus]SPC34474.1 Threonine--tRNA ligase [Candidatus Nitrosocaldus cavascurensis]